MNQEKYPYHGSKVDKYLYKFTVSFGEAMASLGKPSTLATAENEVRAPKLITKATKDYCAYFIMFT